MSHSDNTVERTSVGKIVPKTLGNPKKAAALDNVGDKLMLGTIMGEINGTASRAMPNGDVFTAVTGTFLALPADRPNVEIDSGVLYMPGGIQEMFIQIGKVAEKDGASVRFSVDIVCKRDTNAAGYSYEVVNNIQPKKNNVMDELRAMTHENRNARQQGQLAAPRAGDNAKVIDAEAEDVTAAEAPAPKGKGGK